MPTENAAAHASSTSHNAIMEPEPWLLDRRAAMRQLAKSSVDALGPSPPGIAETWLNIALSDGWVSRTLVVYPVSEGREDVRSYPLVVYFHGGGFANGSPELVLLPARAYALHFGAVVACPSYKFCPENQFPASVHSAWDACAWLSDPQNLNNGVLEEAGVRVDPELGFVIGGTSSGGNLIAAIGGIQAISPASRARLTDGLRPMASHITGLFAGIPVILNEAMLPKKFKPLFTSRDDNSDGGGQGLTTSTIRQVEHYLAADVHSPWWSPLNIDASDFEAQKHPSKVFIQAGALDPLRDDAIIYEKWLQEVGAADTKLVVLEGLGHIAWLTPDWPGSAKEQTRPVSLDGMGWLLGRDWDRTREGKY